MFLYLVLVNKDLYKLILIRTRLPALKALQTLTIHPVVKLRQTLVSKNAAEARKRFLNKENRHINSSKFDDSSKI